MTEENGVAVAGLSEAKEAPGFRAGALQPRPPTNLLLTVQQLRPAQGESIWRRCLSLDKVQPASRHLKPTAHCPLPTNH